MLHFVHHALVADDDDCVAEYAAVCVVLIALMQLSTCAAVRLGRPARAFEAASGLSVALVCVVTLLMRGTYFDRQVLVTVLMSCWGTRLSYFLYTRKLDSNQNVVSRIVWATVCALPAVVCNTSQREGYRTTPVELVCAVTAFASVVLEAIADTQKQEWHASNVHTGRPGRASDEPPVCAVGLWALSRHANLFFELSFHWSVFFVVRPVEAPWIALCPLVLTALIHLMPGGIVAREMERTKLYAFHLAYLRYRDETPVLVPLPLLKGALEQCNPRAAEVLCFELPVYKNSF